MTFHIRWMIRRDMPEVLAIEHASFEFPWCEEEFLRVLRQRNCIGMVAECGDRIVGFMVYELHRTRIEAVKLAVNPEDRRRGVGRALVATLAGKLSIQRRNKVAITIRESSFGSQLFLRATGLKAVNVLRGYYEDTGEDAYRFCYTLRSPSREEAEVTSC